MQLTCNKWQVLLLLEPKAPLGQFAILGSVWPKWIVLFWRGFFVLVFDSQNQVLRAQGARRHYGIQQGIILTRPLPERQLLWNWERCVSDKQHPPFPACSLFEVACGQKRALSTGLIWVLLIQGLVCCGERLQFPHMEPNRLSPFFSAGEMSITFRASQDSVQVRRENQRWADIQLDP